MDQRQKILQIVRIKGPVLPSQINKELETNSLFAGAMLSELVDKKELHISHVKVGTSPLYYLKGQEYRLQNYYKQLHEKEKKAYDIIKKSQILKDEDQAPVIRAALRAIKDFAKPLTVTYNKQKVLFWKWYLLEEKKAVEMIKEKLNIKKEEPKIDPEEVKKVKEEMEAEKKKESVKEEKPTASVSESVKEKKEIKKDTEAEEKKESKEEKSFIDRTGEDNFHKKIERFFNKNNISIINSKVIRKNSEIDFIVEVPSAVGKLQYYCKAKNKKKSNEGDLSSVFVKAQLKKLPALYITTGDITKKALNMLKTDFSNISIKKIN